MYKNFIIGYSYKMDAKTGDDIYTSGADWWDDLSLKNEIKFNIFIYVLTTNFWVTASHM